MTKTLKTITFAAAMLLSLSIGATDAFAKEAKHGRETAWTDLEPLPLPIEIGLPGVSLDPGGVTWEE